MTSQMDSPNRIQDNGMMSRRVNGARDAMYIAEHISNFVLTPIFNTIQKVSSPDAQDHIYAALCGKR